MVCIKYSKHIQELVHYLAALAAVCDFIKIFSIAATYNMCIYKIYLTV